MHDREELRHKEMHVVSHSKDHKRPHKKGSSCLIKRTGAFLWLPCSSHPAVLALQISYK